MLLTPNKYSRPCKPLKSVEVLVIHYVANPKTTALQNRNFFEMRKDGNEGYGSAHYIIDDNEIIQCIPFNEMAYHVGAKKYTEYGLSISSYPNARTLGIEMCHPTKSGKPTEEVRSKTVELLKALCRKFNLNPLERIKLHHDITGKDCHKYYVDNPEEFDKLKEGVNL